MICSSFNFGVAFGAANLVYNSFAIYFLSAIVICCNQFPHLRYLNKICKFVLPWSQLICFNICQSAPFFVEQLTFRNANLNISDILTSRQFRLSEGWG